MAPHLPFLRVYDGNLMDSVHSSDFPRSPIWREVLAYLFTHPDAQDTVEGIVTWWLMTLRITQQTVKVKVVLAELVTCRLVLERKGPDGRMFYRVNKKKIGEIRRLLDTQGE